MTTTKAGKVKFFNEHKQFGFIEASDGGSDTRPRHRYKLAVGFGIGLLPMRRSPDWMFLMTREQYLAQAASLRRSGEEYLARQFETLFALRTDYVESPSIVPDEPTDC